MPKKDPFGQAMLDYLNGNHTENIRVDSNITEDEVIPVDYLFRKGTDLPEKELMALSMVKGKTLDVGAGSGCHSLYLQERGFDVTALDYSADCIEAVKKQGVKSVVEGDFFEYEGQYDTLLFLMNGLGIMGTVDRLDLFFQKCKTSLKPGGQIIGESTDIIYMFQEEDGSVMIDLNDAYYGEMEYQMTYKDIKGDWFAWLYIAYEILEDAAKRNGFTIEKFYEGEESDYLVRMGLA